MQAQVLTVLLGAILLCGHVIAAEMPCPRMCTCRNENRWVSCERHKLQNVPEGIPSSVTELYLGFNLLMELPKNVFSQLSNLTTLSLKNNVLMSKYVDPDAFRGLTKLKVIFLTKNKLTTLNANLFRDLTSLTKLYLTNNALTKIPDLGFATSLVHLGLDNDKLQAATFPAGFLKLLHLTTIILSNNHQFQTLAMNDTAALRNSDIRKINFANCDLRSVEVDVFSSWANLQSLSLSYNSHLTQASVLHIISDLSQCTMLTNLDLSGVIQGNFVTLPSDTFEPLRNGSLLQLDLSHMKGVDIIQERTFSPLTSLTYLNLQFCDFRLIRKGAFAGTNTLQTLLLFNTHLSAIPQDLPPSLKLLDLGRNGALEDIPHVAFQGLSRLHNLSLAHCNVNKIYGDAFVGLNDLRWLDLSFNQIGGSNIGNKVLEPLISLRYLFLNHNKMSTIVTQEKLFEQQTKLLHLDLSDNLCQVLPPQIFQYTKTLRVLELHGNALGTVINAQGNIFASLGDLECLNLSGNAITEIPVNLFKSLKSLKVLDLHSNGVQSWESGLFNGTRSLSMLDLSQNHISAVNESSIVGLPDHLTLDLRANPFNCWCDLMWFRRWMGKMINSTTGVNLIGYSTYKCNSPGKMAGKLVVDFKPEDIASACSPLPWLYILIGTVGGVVCMGLIMATVLYRYRWSIRLRYYLAKRRLRRKKDAQNGYQPIPEQLYDIAVSYAEEDYNWVREELHPRLDKTNGGNWQLFVEGLDAAPNKSLIEEIGEAMFTSRKVILVISQDYLKDSRRQYETQLALSSVDERETTLDYVVILVLLQEAADVQLPRELRPLAKEGRALVWTPNDQQGQELFWLQLSERINEQAVPLNIQI